MQNNSKEQICNIIISPDEIIKKRVLSVETLATVSIALTNLISSKNAKAAGEKGSVRAIFLHEEVSVSPLVNGGDENETYNETTLLGVIGPNGLAISIEGLLDDLSLAKQLNEYQKDGVPLIINNGSLSDADKPENDLSFTTSIERELARLKAGNALRQIVNSRKR